MKFIKFLFWAIPAVLVCAAVPSEGAVLGAASSDAGAGAGAPLMIKEVRNRENFRITWKYPKPETLSEKYYAEILNKKIISFSNLLDEILAREGSGRISVLITPSPKNAFDRQRKTVFLEGGDNFNIKKSLDVIVSELGLKVEASSSAVGVASSSAVSGAALYPPRRSAPERVDYSGIRDYFGEPVPYRGGFLAFFQMNGKFYLSIEKSGKSSLLLEEDEYFDSIKSAGKNFIAYKLRDSLWFVNIKRKKNFRYYTTTGSPDDGWWGELFLKTFDSGGEFCAVVVISGGKSHILYGKLSGAPEILFSGLPYIIDKIYISGDKIIFSAQDGEDKTIIGVASASQKKIFNLYSISEQFIVMGKYSGGILLFYPRSQKITFLDEHHQSVLTSDIKVKKISDYDGIKYLIAPLSDNLGENIQKALLESYSPRAVYLSDVNHLNFLYKKLLSSDYYSFYPLAVDECVFLETDGYTRKFKKYAIRGLLSEERLLFEKNNSRRKYSLALSAFFAGLIVIAQGVINVKKKQKTG